MQFTLTDPCKKCPFRSDIKPYLNADRVAEICDAPSFACHQTTVEDESSDEGDMKVTDKSQMCAGYMILREKIKAPSQMMRIAERLGLYNYKKLNMKAPVFKTIKQMIKRNGNG